MACCWLKVMRYRPHLNAVVEIPCIVTVTRVSGMILKRIDFYNTYLGTYLVPRSIVKWSHKRLP